MKIKDVRDLLDGAGDGHWQVTTSPGAPGLIYGAETAGAARFLVSSRENVRFLLGEINRLHSEIRELAEEMDEMGRLIEEREG